MEITKRRLADIVPYAANAKKHDKRQINNVAESIKQYGFVQPIVIDRDGVIVIGHCRAMAAKKLGMEEVPCVCVDDLTPEQVNALRLVDNKSNESDWDFDLLADELPGLDLSAFDFDWGLRDELDTSVVEDNYDPVLPAEPKSKPGDVYQLGDHRLMCGDSTSLTDVQKLVGGAQMDLLLTDPPYNVDYQGTAGKIKNDNMEDTAFRRFLTDAFSAEHPTMKPIKLFDYQMQCSSKPGENVLDLFAGSGTTIMAAEQNGRHAFCMEYDPKYADVIIDRWKKFTGEKAVLLHD